MRQDETTTTKRNNKATMTPILPPQQLKTSTIELLGVYTYVYTHASPDRGTTKSSHVRKSRLYQYFWSPITHRPSLIAHRSSLTFRTSFSSIVFLISGVSLLRPAAAAAAAPFPFPFPCWCCWCWCCSGTNTVDL